MGFSNLYINTSIFQKIQKFIKKKQLKEIPLAVIKLKI
jgi:hypothetical protein